MALKAIHCKLCGGMLKKLNNGIYQCENNFSHKFKEQNIAEQREELLSLFGEALYLKKEEDIANIRSNLWSAVHEENIDSKKIIDYCRELKKLLPEDFQADFYEIANGKNLPRINKFLDEIDVCEQRCYLDDIVEFMVKSLESKNVSSLKNLIGRVFKNNEYTKYITLVEEEAEKLDKGIYEPKLPRDVFVAYSSADMAKVNEITEYLESQGISCFVAIRNLRHGRGAVENYKTLLETAMHNCKCVVFISSENSRTLACDALSIELPYIRDNEPNISRIEYVIQDYKSTSDAAKILLEEFFDGLEYCRTKEDLLKRILKYKTSSNKNDIKTNVKYCLSCGEENPMRAKACMACGKSEFVSSQKEYFTVKVEEARKRQQKEFAHEHEKLRRAHEEELARKHRELEKKIEQQQEELLRKQKELEEQLRKKLEAEYKEKISANAVQLQVKENKILVKEKEVAQRDKNRKAVNTYNKTPIDKPFPEKCSFGERDSRKPRVLIGDTAEFEIKSVKISEISPNVYIYSFYCRFENYSKTYIKDSRKNFEVGDVHIAINCGGGVMFQDFNMNRISLTEVIKLSFTGKKKKKIRFTFDVTPYDGRYTVIYLPEEKRFKHIKCFKSLLW